MTQLAKHYTNEETGISYTLSPERYYLPDLILPEEPPELVELAQGRYALMRRHYLKNYRQGLFVSLLTQGKLTAHLAEIQEAASTAWS